MLAILMLVKPHLGFHSQISRQKSHPSFKKENILRFFSQKEWTWNHVLILQGIVKIQEKSFYPFLFFTPATFLLKLLLAHKYVWTQEDCDV